MRAYDIAFAGALAHRFPVLLPLLQEHLDDYDGLLPHVFMGDITRWVVHRFLTDPSDPILRDVLDFVECSFESAGTDDRELVSVSFLENLPRIGDNGAGVRGLIGPALQNELRRLER